MSVNNEISTSGPYEGNGVATAFSITFTIQKREQVVVYKQDTDGEITTLVQDTDYAVTGFPSAGIVSMFTAPATGEKLLLVSNYQETQLTEFESQGGFFPDVHEDAFDKLTYLIQQINRNALQFPVSFTRTSNSLPSAREGYGMKWDADGNLVEENLDNNLKKDGTDGGMTGELQMNDNRITGLPAPASPDEPVRSQDINVLVTGEGLIITSNIQNFTLASGQTVVTLTELTTTQTAFFISGVSVDQGRLVPTVDYTVDSETQITLTESYPEGALLTAVQNEGAERVISDVQVFDNVASMKSASLSVGDTAMCKRYYAGGELVEGLVYEIKSGGPSPDGYRDHEIANGTTAELTEAGEVNVLRAGARGDDSTDDILPIQACVAYAELFNPRKTVYIPDGRVYRTSKAIVLNTASLRSGESLCVIRRAGNETSGLAPIASPAGGTTVYDVDAGIIVTNPPSLYANVKKIENILIQYINTRGGYGVYAPYWNSFTMRNVRSINVDFGTYGEIHFMCTYEGVIHTTVGTGFKINSIGTSMSFIRCWANSCDNGFDLNGVVYSSLVSCAVDSAVGAFAYQFTLCRGLSLTSCGAEFARCTNLLRVVGGLVTVNGFDTFDNSPSFSMINILSSARVVMNTARFENFSDLQGVNEYNYQVVDGSHLITNECSLPTNGDTFNSFSSGATYTENKAGVTTYRSAGETYSVGLGNSPSFAKSASNVSVPAGGIVTTGFGRKAVNPTVSLTATATDTIPAVYPVVATNNSNGTFTIRYFNDADYTSQNFGTFNIDWSAF